MNERASHEIFCNASSSITADTVYPAHNVKRRLCEKRTNHQALHEPAFPSFPHQYLTRHQARSRASPLQFSQVGRSFVSLSQTRMAGSRERYVTWTRVCCLLTWSSSNTLVSDSNVFWRISVIGRSRRAIRWKVLGDMSNGSQERGTAPASKYHSSISRRQNRVLFLVYLYSATTRSKITRGSSDSPLENMDGKSKGYEIQQTAPDDVKTKWIYNLADVRGSSETLTTLCIDTSTRVCVEKDRMDRLQFSCIYAREEHRQGTRSILQAFHDMELALD